MPRREHIKSDSYIDWLKSLGCIFYCPCDGTTGLKDLISGVVGVTTGSSTAVYDSNSDSYLITKDSTANQNYPAVKWYGLDMSFVNPTYIEFSWLMEIKPVSSPNYSSSSFLMQSFKGRILATNLQYFGISVPSSNFIKIADAIKADGIAQTSLYTNGMQVFNTINNWQWSILASDYYTGIDLQNPGTYNQYTRTLAYYRNIMVFNRQLSQNEIKQVQNIQ